MSMTIVLSFLFAAGLAQAAGWSRAAVVAAAAAAAALWLIGSGLVTRALLDRLQSHPRLAEPEWRTRNVIVLLGWEIVKWPDGGVTVGVRGASRVQEAARLYRLCTARGKSCTILASSGDPTHLGRSEAAAMAEELAALGVPANDVLLEARSDNTFQNADYSSRLITERGFDQVVIVTSGFHLSRSLLYFAHFLPPPLVGAAADRLAAIFSIWPTALNMSHFDLVATEIAGILRYHAYTWLGWNAPTRNSAS